MTHNAPQIFHFAIKKFDDNLFKVSYYPDKLKKKNRTEIIVPSKTGDRFDSSISRSRSKIFEYAYCNDFEYFITLTIDPKKRDSKDLKSYISSLSRFIRYYREKYNCNIQYLLIPEQHKSGSWHLHGLIKGLPADHLSINKNGYLDWFEYSDRFGYISLSKVRDKERISKYITKYIAKGFDQTELDSGSKLYYCSRGLNKPSRLLDLLVQDYNELSQQFQSEPLDYQNEFIKIKYINQEEYNLKYKTLVDSFISKDQDFNIYQELEEKEGRRKGHQAPKDGNKINHQLSFQI